jgi:type I restriction enzyme R subunit
MAVIEAKRSTLNPADAAAQGRAYAEQLVVPFVFLSNGKEIRFWDFRTEAHPRPIKTLLQAGRSGTAHRRAAPSGRSPYGAGRPAHRRARLSARMHRYPVPGDQPWPPKVVSRYGHRHGQDPHAAALIKRLFQANAISRVLFLVDRIPLALQTEDAFNEHLREYPAYVLRAGRRFQDEKRITITTLQSMINIYRDYSSGYFDLVISDECHRSIYGKWKGVLLHFEDVQIGLTATPCVMGELDTGDEEDRESLRDTLRFFQVDRPTFTYDLRQAIRDDYSCPTRSTRPRRSRPQPREDSRSSVTKCRGRTSMRRHTKSWEERLAIATRSWSTPPYWSASLLSPSATVPSCASSRTMRNGYLDRRGRQRKPLIASSGSGSRRSSSR